MDSTLVSGELVEYSKEHLFRAFQFLSAAAWAGAKPGGAVGAIAPPIRKLNQILLRLIKPLMC